MKFIWMNFLAILIAVSVLVIETPSIQSELESITSLQQIPQFDVSPLRNDTKKSAEKTIYIAQDFIPLVVLADVQNPNIEYHHYLPLYGRLRQKEYFLLI